MPMDHPFRILILAQLPPPIHGSATISKMVAESRLLNSTFSIKTLPLQFAKNVKDLGSLSLGKLVKMVRFAFQLISAIRNFKPDLVYFTISPFGLSFYRDILYVSILKLYGMKIAYHLHMKGIKEESERNAYKRSLYKFLFKNTYIITLSEHLRADVASVFSGTPHVVNNGVNPVTGEETSLQKSEQPKKVQLLYLSNLMKAKGIFIFLDAVLWLSKKNNNFSARIIGNAGDVSKEEIQSYILQNNLSERIVIEDGMSGEEKYHAFKMADIFIHPTLNDAFPLVILEAMQFQLPVISTFEGAIPEIVTDGVTGYLVQKNEAVALAQKTEQLLFDAEKRIQMGKAGRQKFLTHYTAAMMENNLRDTLLKIISEKQA